MTGTAGGLVFYPAINLPVSVSVLSTELTHRMTKTCSTEAIFLKSTSPENHAFDRVKTSMQCLYVL